jgi:hypothetical protein
MPKPRPKEVKERLDRIINGWETLAPTKSFGGLTVTQFKAAVQPSYTVRQEILALDEQLNAKQAQRDSVDEDSMDSAELVVNGVIGDPTEGPDSALYESFGYVRKSEKKSGLTHKKTGSKSGQGGTGT